MKENRIDALEKALQELRKENLILHNAQHKLSKDIVVALIVLSILILIIFFKVI